MLFSCLDISSSKKQDKPYQSFQPNTVIDSNAYMAIILNYIPKRAKTKINKQITPLKNPQKFKPSIEGPRCFLL